MFAVQSTSRLWSLDETEELVEFTDYTPDFHVDAQESEPRVKCFDLRKLSSWGTPNAQFFAFHQSRTARVDATTWRLRIGGFVERPGEFSLGELRARRDRRELAATLECSGNWGHAQLMNGLVSNATWTGVGLAALLAECGVRSDAREVVFFGLDSEKERKWQAAGREHEVPHGRSLFVQDAVDPDVLLAFAMNGEPIPTEHGFPLRLIVPGWYAMASVKWLSRIEVLDRRYEGRHMARNYQSLHALPVPEGTIWLETSITKNRLKSVVARVTRRRGGATSTCRVAGAAWGGPSRIEAVEVKIDDGAWKPCRIDCRAGNYAWVLWSHEWHAAAPGAHTLVSRAVAANGEVQPTKEELRRRLASNREDNSQWVRSVRI